MEILTVKKKAKQRNQKEKKERVRKPSPKSKLIPCAICGTEKFQKELYNVRVWSEKLLILLSGLVRKQISEICAQRHSASIGPFLVCPVHLIDACEELYVMLEVTSPFNIPRARRELVHIAMEKVESFQTGCECLPIVSNWHFLQIVYNFIVKHQHKTGKVPLPQNIEYYSPGYRPGAPRDRRLDEPLKDSRNRCRLCNLIQEPKEIKHMTLKYEKIIVIMMALVREELDLASANRLFSIKKVMICRVHLIDAGEQFMKFLGVHDPTLIKWASGSVAAHNAVTLANCFIGSDDREVIEDYFLKKMQEICLTCCKNQLRRPKIGPTLVEPDELFVVREEVVGDGNVLMSLAENVGSPEEENIRIVEESDDEDIEIDVVKVDEPGDLPFISLPPPPEPPKKPVELNICHICEKMSESVQDVAQRSEKLCLLLISVHRNDISAQTAQKLHEILILQVCHEHFIGSCRDLFAMIRLVHPMGRPADKERLQKVIQLANYIRNLPKVLKEPLLINFCREFWKKYGGEREVIPKKEQSETVESCRLCGVMRRRSDVRSISVLSEKLIVLVAEVYKCGMTKGLARQYFHQLRELVICQWHLPEVCKTLCTMLSVPRPEAFQFPKESLVNTVMEMVETIQKGRYPYATTDGKHFIRQCQRFTCKYWKRKELMPKEVENSC